MKTANLIMVTEENNNKFYNMTENLNGTFTVNYGRVGAKGQFESYPISKWSSIYGSKTKKGYKDVTSLKSVSTAVSLKDVTDVNIMKLLADLQKYSKLSILENYLVTSEQVTIAQVDKAQSIIDSITTLVKSGNIINSQIDSLLTELYMIIPRKMANVKDFIMNGTGDFLKAKRIIEREQNSLDVMRGQVSTVSTVADQTLEDILGVKITKVTDSKIIDEVKSLMGSEVNRFKNVYEVIKTNTQKSFDEQLPKSVKNWTKLLWHGSRNENWLNIIKTGLMIRPSCAVITGAMFGNGIYFADKCAKSLGYTSAKGSIWAKGNSNQAFMALYEVNTGMEYRVERHDSSFTSFDFNKLQQKGKFDSLFAKSGYDLKNNEYIIYKQEQCTIKYFVEIS